MGKIVNVSAIFLLSLAVQTFAQAGISDILLDKLNEAERDNKPVRTIVMLRDQVDIVSLDQQLYARKTSVEERAYVVIKTLQDKASRTQPPFVSFLNAKSHEEVIQYQRFWVINMVMVEALPAVIYEIADRPEIWYLDWDSELDWDKPQGETPSFARANSSEIGLKRINAHMMWELGYTGAGTIVMNIDTGVDGNHPAYAARWRGADPGVPDSVAWFDPDGSTFPHDTDSHGSHTMGIMTGMDPVTNDTVGVAFGAQWIAARTIGPSGDFQSLNIAAFQWAMDPDGNPGTINDMPIAIGCSWQDPYVGDCDVTYQMLFNSVEAAGIGIVFSAGNAGGSPNSSTITHPKNLNTTLVNTWATGGVDGNNPNLPAYSSTSKGPSRCGGTGSLLIKPEACAPAVSVRSAIPGGSYGNKTGTSMACPHVVGAIALLKEAHPTLTGHELKMALYLTAKETPADTYPGEDNTFGMGIIDVYAAHMSLADPDDPNPPDNLSAYSDYTTPNSIMLNWTDPTTYVNGDPLTNFQIKVYRDSTFVTNVPSGVETYNDPGLNDGQVYEYTLYAADIPNDSLSAAVEISGTAGGSRVPKAPTGFTITLPSPPNLMMHWTNPADNIDGTPMDDFDGINLYEDGSLVMTYNRTGADTGRADSASYTPPSGTHQYYVTAFDNETPSNESAQSNAAYSPIDIPFFDNFPVTGPPNPGYWINNDCEVTAEGDNPPSTPYVLNLDGDPNGGGDVALLPVDLSGMSGSGIILAYWWQPQGLGDTPEAGDDLYVDFLNDQGTWVEVRHYVGSPNQPFQQEVIDIASESPGSGATFFFPGFQFRFRNSATAGAFDDWNIDDVFLGLPSANPKMFVTPQAIGDTLLVGGSSVNHFTIANQNPLPSSLNYSVSVPFVNWLSVAPISGTVTSAQTDTLEVILDASSISSGDYSADLIISGNDTTNLQDTISVTLHVNDAPVISIAPDTFDVYVESGGTAIDTVTIRNTGLGPLYFTIKPDQPAKKSAVAKVDETTLSPAVLKAMIRRSSATGELNSINETEQIPFSGAMAPDQIMGEEIFGSTANSFSGTLRDRGNIFGVTTSTTLIEQKFYLNITTDTELTFFVYRGTSATGTFNKIDEVHFQNSGTGMGFYSSGPINVPLEAGFYYYIGASWPGNATYYRGNESTPLSASFGTLETGIPGNIAGGFPPGATASNTYSGFSPYYCTIVTGVGIDWITADPDTGEIAAGDSLDVEVSFNATGLVNGHYYADVVISSNDPINPEKRVGAHMQVAGGTIVPLPDSINFDTTYVGSETTISISFLNLGSDTLEVYNMLLPDPAFTVDTSSFKIFPLDSQEVNVTFAPLAQGEYEGLMKIVSSWTIDTVAVHLKGYGDIPVGIQENLGLPNTYDISPNYPNPFNPTTTIRYQLPQNSDVILLIYNVLGQKVRMLLNSRIDAGYHSVEWDGRNDAGARVGSGIYIYRFSAGNFLRIRKMIMLK